MRLHLQLTAIARYVSLTYGDYMTNRLYNFYDLNIQRDQTASVNMNFRYLDVPFNLNAGYSVPLRQMKSRSSLAQVGAFTKSSRWEDAMFTVAMDILKLPRIAAVEVRSNDICNTVRN